MRRGVQTRGGGERSEADGDANAAYDHNGGTGALQNGDYERGPIKPARAGG